MLETWSQTLLRAEKGMFMPFAGHPRLLSKRQIVPHQDSPGLGFFCTGFGTPVFISVKQVTSDLGVVMVDSIFVFALDHRQSGTRRLGAPVLRISEQGSWCGDSHYFGLCLGQAAA